MPRGRRTTCGFTGLLLMMLTVLVGLASALQGRRGLGSTIKQEPIVPEKLLVKDDWIITRDFFYKRDQNKNGADKLNVRDNRLAKFDKTGEVGYWKVVRRPIPGAPKRRIPLISEGMDFFVLDIPEQGERKNLIVSYEIPVAGGRYHPSSVMYAGKGSIYVASSTGELTGPAAAARKKIGSFSVDLPTLEPMVDRNFTL